MNAKWLKSWVMLGALCAVLAASGCTPCPECPEQPPAAAAAEELGVTIHIDLDASTNKPKADNPTANVSIDPAKGNHIRWQNRTSESITIHFESADWSSLFMGPARDVVVAASKHSEWLTMKDDATVGAARGYTPSFSDGRQPPTEPTVTPVD